MIQALQYLKTKTGITEDVAKKSTKSVAKKESTEVKVQKTKDDHFSNSRPDEFSSENFNLEIGGLSKNFPLSHLRKLMKNKLQLDVHKVKPGAFGRQVAYVTFKNEELKTKAKLILNGYSWHNCKLTAVDADPTKDPVLLKKIDFLVNAEKCRDLPLADRITKAVTPYHNLSYEDQIKEKDRVVKNLMKKFAIEISSVNPELEEFVNWQRRRRHGQVCQLDDFIQSPVKEGYRNKCEFTIGQSSGSPDPVVGFRVASYKEGSVEVGPIGHLKHINKEMKTVAVHMEKFIKSSGYEVFQPFSHKGIWRQLTVRTSNNDDIMLIVVIHPQEMNEEEITKLKESLTTYFTSDGDGVEAMVTSIFFQRYGQKESGRDIEYEHIWGTNYIEETILGKTYCAAPDAFLQVNTPVCELLYSKVIEIAEVDAMTVVLDICCGVGTIGLSAAEDVHKVYGVELTESAVINARLNASNNDVTNHVAFHGRAEEHIDNMIKRSERFKTVAIIDPPKDGLHGSVMNALRKCENLNTLVYISCDPQAAMNNFTSLCRPRSKAYKGTFFVPVRAVPVDLFPDTPHFELIIIFERYDECKWNRIVAGNPRPKDQAYYDTIPAINYELEEEKQKEKNVPQRNGRGQQQRPFNVDRNIWGNLRKEPGYDDETQEYYGEEPETPYDLPMEEPEMPYDLPMEEPETPYDLPMEFFIDNPERFHEVSPQRDRAYNNVPAPPAIMDMVESGPRRPPGGHHLPRRGGRPPVMHDYDHRPNPGPPGHFAAFENGYQAAIESIREESRRADMANSEHQAFPPLMRRPRGDRMSLHRGRDGDMGFRNFEEDGTEDDFDSRPMKRSRFSNR